MSLAADCPDCCTCPQPTVEWDSRSASKTKCGLPEFDGYVSTPPKRYLTVTLAGITGSVYFENSSDPCGDDQDPYTITYSGSATLDAHTCDAEECSALLVITEATTGKTYGFRPFVFGVAPIQDSAIANICPLACSDFGSEIFSDSIPATPTSATTATYQSGAGSATLSDEYTTAQLVTNTIAALPSWPGTWAGTAGAFINISTDELSCAARVARYRLRFKIPLVGTGKNYRASWVERFIPEAGVGVSSVEVYSPGVYRPAVTISAPPAGGPQALAVAVMSSAGGVASIRILNPGAGYTSAPTVTVQSATGGGTTSTGWSATLGPGGQIAAISGGTAGDYLPTLSFSSGGATAICTMDAQGGIATVSLTAPGSGHTSEPTLTITAKVSGATPADLLVHLGTETARCIVWGGVTPGGYDPATPSTYPILGDGTDPYFTLDVPSSDGTTLVANLRAVCDGSACP